MHFQGRSHIFVLSNNPSIGSHPTKMKVIPFLPNYMYCFLPSDANHHGSLRVVDHIPSFLKSFKFLLEVDKVSTHLDPINTLPLS